MKRITIREAQKLGGPNPFGLVVTRAADGKPNLMALSWWTYASNNPPLLAVCLSQRGYSAELIRASGEFALCLVDGSLKDAAFACGTRSGRSVDKAEQFGIELIDADSIGAKLVRESRIAFECRVEQVLPAGDHWIFLANVLAVHADETKSQLFATGGYGALTTL